jgi:phage gpG-like protein
MVGVQINASEAIKDIEKIRMIFQNQNKYKIFRNMVDILIKVYFAETFDKEGDRRGHAKWAPLNPLYSAYKASKGRSTKPLILTGHGRSSGKVLREDNTSLEFGTEVPYMQYHQNGDGVPQREFLFITKQDFDEISVFLGQMIQGILNKEVGGV